MVRGILCIRCNTLLGQVEQVGLDRIHYYLESFPLRLISD